MEGDVLHVVSPYHKGSPTRAPSKVVMSDKKASFKLASELQEQVELKITLCFLLPNVDYAFLRI